MTDGLFWCPRHVLDVQGSFQGLFWRRTAFFDNRQPFLMSAARTRRQWQPSRPFLTGDGLFWLPRRFQISFLDLSYTIIAYHRGLMVMCLDFHTTVWGSIPRRNAFLSTFTFFFNWRYAVKTLLIHKKMQGRKECLSGMHHSIQVTSVTKLPYLQWGRHIVRKV